MVRLLVLETRLLLRDRVAILVLFLAIATSVLAVANGKALLASQIAGRAASIAEDRKAQAEWREQLGQPGEPAAAVLLPMRIRLAVNAPLPPLLDASAGRAAFENYTTAASLRARADSLFKRTQLGNPELLARGSLDLAFVAVVVAPLLLIALGHGLFTADRDSGAARLVLAQAGSPARLLLARSLPRLALVALPLLAALLVLVATGPEIPGRTPAALAWAGIALLSLAFWWAVILLLNALRISAETAALALVSAWALATLVLPALITAIAQVAYPPPSRFEQIAAARAAEVASTTAYENDHPDLASQDFAGRLASVRKSHAINTRVAAAVAPIAARFDARLAQQQQGVATLSLLSPALVTSNALASVAGTSLADALAFRRATTEYLATLKTRLGGYIDRGELLSPAAFESLPRFAMAQPLAIPGTALAWLAGLTLLLSGLAIRRYAAVQLD